MELKGLKINFLGDSITQGSGVSTVENTYWNLMKQEYGAVQVRGYGISGTRIAKQQNPTNDNGGIDYLDFCTRYSQMDDDADVVVVFGGTNDYGHGNAPLGNPDDRSPETFYGACHTLFSGLLEKYPDATIVVMTPLHRYWEEAECTPKNIPLSAYVNIIKEVAEFYALPVLDLWSVSSIQPRVEAIKQKYCPDGLHPNDAGHALIARRLAGFLKTL